MMAGLSYVGPAPEDDDDIANRLQLDNILDTADVNRVEVASQITAAANLRASKTYVDTQDAQFAEPAYYISRDALNLPISAKGAPNGVATLDGSGKIPVTQLPVLGAGYMLGPFGITSENLAVTATNTPIKFADFNIGVQNMVFQPLAFMAVFVTASGDGMPVVELCMSDGAAPYDDQVVIARGVGRHFYNDTQAVVALPVAHASNVDPYPGSTNIVVSAYLRDAMGGTAHISSVSQIATAQVYLLRTQE